MRAQISIRGRRLCLPGLAVVILGLASQGWAQVPALLSYQGRVLVNGTNYTGSGLFKFALVSADGVQKYWLNAPDTNGDGQPDTNVAVGVSGGLFTVQLGDTSLANMAALPVSVFTNLGVYVRIWFAAGSGGFQQLAPDQRITSVGYALLAGNVPDGAITPTKLAANTVAAVTATLSAQVSALASQLTALSNQLSALSNQSGAFVAPGATVASSDPQDAGLASKGFEPFATLPAPGWATSSADGAPSPRSGQAGVWTGQELMVWGGSAGPGLDLGSGGRYRPDLDAWQPRSTLNAPAPRTQHTAVWSGQEMVVWGGLASGSFVTTGARFNPSNNLWTVLSTNGARDGRLGHVAAWTGSQMLIWGGRNNSGLLNDGATYDPVADQWSPFTLDNGPAAALGATGVSTGSRVIIWGGQGTQGPLNTGAQLVLDDSGLPLAWLPLSTSNAPSPRSGHAAVWTGQKMLIWGGQGGGAFLGDGAAYDPVADTWSAVAATNAPLPRSNPSAVWTGQEMLIFGGDTSGGPTADGAAYDPLANQWRPLSSAGNPLARSGATAVWSGSELLVFGGLVNGAPTAWLQRLNPQPTWYLYRKP